MNTKQLWTALCLNPVTNSYFDGIYSIDTLKTIEEKPELIICNTDPSNKPGKHWVLFFFKGENVDFFDSLGWDIEYYGSEFINFIKTFANKYKQCLKRLQPLGSELCGHYCLYYAYAKCNSKSMEEIVNTMSSADVITNFVKSNFFICPRYNCPLLQKCIEC